MSAGKHSVEHSAMTEHVQSLQTNHQTLQEQSSRFLEVIEPLKEVWKGTSSQPWNEMTQAWKESMDGVNQALEQLTSRFEGAAMSYRSGEEAQASTLQNRFAGMDLPQSGSIL